MPKDNLLFKLDNLEYQWHYSKGTVDKFEPRLSSTTKLYNAKGKKTSKRIKMLLDNIKVDELESALQKLRLEIFEKKVYHLEKSLYAFILKALAKGFGAKEGHSAKKDFTTVIQTIKEQYGLEKFAKLVVKSKIIKLCISKINNAKVRLGEQHVKWFEEHEMWTIQHDKANEWNPSRIWNDVIMNIKKSDQVVSTLLNATKSKELIKSFDNGMDVFLGINKEKKIKERKLEAPDELEDVDNEDDGSHNSRETTVSIGKGLTEEELFEQYEGMLADSDNESESSNDGDDDTVNYNDVTDKEEDSEDDRPESKRAKTSNLPEFMVGYYSGDDISDYDAENDKIAKEQASNEPKRKNRRGQRARRKIWEKKYGKNAKHVQREIEKEMKERQQRQEEYEVRVAKREAKAAAREAEVLKQKEEDAVKKMTKSESSGTVEHPSWVAKKLEEEKLKNAKFSGKKIKFD